MPDGIDNSKVGLLKDIRTLITLFNTNWGKNISVIGPLQNALKDCKENSTDSSWKFNLNNLTFRNIDVGVNARPHGIKSSNADLSLQLTVKNNGKFINDTSITDPLISLSFSAIISGKYINENNDDEIVSVMSSFHLDKGGGNTQRDFIHPEYHINFGGTSMTKANDFSFGNLLLMGSPRVAHMPLDAILAIDFVIKNFYEKKNHKKLTELPAYIRIMKNAQFRIWRPYSLSLASNWKALNPVFKIDNSFVPSKLLPNLC